MARKSNKSKSKSKSNKSRSNALTTKPKKIKALSQELGQILQNATIAHQQGQFAQAEKLYRTVLSARPDYPAANKFMGFLAKDVGQSEHAIKFLEASLVGAPNDAEVLNEYGILLAERRDYEQAIRYLDKACKLEPRNHNARYNLATAQYENKEFRSALSNLEIILKLAPNNLEAITNTANSLTELNRLPEAVELYAQAAKIAPSNSKVISNYLFNLNYVADLDADELVRLHREVASNLPAPQPNPNNRPKNHLTRIGYVSNDLHTHSVSYFFEPLLREHNKEKYEVFCYYNGTVNDEQTDRLKDLSSYWRDIADKSDEALFSQIRSDNIDILIDLSGHTKNNRLNVFAMKAAPIQATWLGYPNSTGLSAIDYRIVDSVSDPEYNDLSNPESKSDKPCSEKLLRLPHGFLSYKTNTPTAEEQSPAPSIDKGYITFGSFNNLLKVNDRVINAWAKILSELPNAKLLIKDRRFSQPEVADGILAKFSALGIAPERIELRGAIKSNDEHMNLYHQIDIALDTFPYNGTTTTAEALSMGVPVVTFNGDRHAARVGASILQAVGEPSLIADNLDQYIELAIALGKEPEKLNALRSGLSEKMSASDFCNAKQFASEMEAAFEQMLVEKGLA